MHRRSTVAAFSFILALGCAVTLPAVAFAQLPSSSLDEAAASVDFPVYKITRARGLPNRAFTVFDHDGETGCPKGSKSVQSDYLPRRRPSSRWIHLTQYGKPCRPPDPAGRKVRRVRVAGQRVTVHLYCARTPLACPHSPRRNGVYVAEFYLRSGGKRSQLIFNAAARVGLRRAVRALRSLRLVDLSRPVVALDHFRSPDGAILCTIHDDAEPGGRYTFCATGGANGSAPQRSARLSIDGTADLCDLDPRGCSAYWDSDAPLLAPGQTARFWRFRCVEQAGAITCTIADGEHAGTGFRIDATGVVALSP
jgi:hypothetical protein